MKKYSSILAAIMLGVVTLMSGCKWLQNIKFSTPDPWEEKQSEGLFYYYVNKIDGEESAVILNLNVVYEMSTIEELVIPETLGGYPVKKVGEVWLPSYSAPAQFYGINASNIKTIKINHYLHLTSFGIENFKGNLLISSQIRYGSGYSEYSVRPLKDCCYVEIGVPFEEDTGLFNLCDAMTDNKDEKHNIVSFEGMGGQINTYSLIVKIELPCKMPQDPVRDGYTFGGWFKEEECLNEWNFETDVVTEDITLYAKWIEE